MLGPIDQNRFENSELMAVPAVPYCAESVKLGNIAAVATPMSALA